MPIPRTLTKSLYLAGLQCPRQLWWRIHRPDAPEFEPDLALRAVFERGRRVGERARDYLPGGVLIDLPHHDRERRLRETRETIAARPRAVYEGAFEHDGVMVVADILEREQDGGGWTLVEVKSATCVKPEHRQDVALQMYVLRGAGLPVNRAEVMHLNPQCRFPDLSDLFVRSDITGYVVLADFEVPDRLREFRAMLEGPMPKSGPGQHCDDPHECPLKVLCWAGVPEHSLWTLYRGSRVRDDLDMLGVRTVDEIPDEVALSDIQRRQRLAVRRNALVVEAGLRRALATVCHPIAYLDFETVGPPIPVWDGMRPYGQAPVQVSVHVERRDGDLKHVTWLADGPGDPREEMAQRVLEFTAGAGSVVVYNASFERRCIRGLAERVPELASALAAVETRLWDLLPVVADHVYHPEFRGSFSMKQVLPALVPGADYEDLDVADGATASLLLEGLLLDDERYTEAEKARLRAALETYCEADTLGMVRLMGRLRELAAV